MDRYRELLIVGCGGGVALSYLLFMDESGHDHGQAPTKTIVIVLQTYLSTGKLPPLPA